MTQRGTASIAASFALCAALGAGCGNEREQPFSARLKGSTVVAELAADKKIYRFWCEDAPSFEKANGDSWVAPQDDRYPSWESPGYYLDDRYVSPTFNEGCDDLSCEPYEAETVIAKALEYVQVGTRPAPEPILPNAESPAREIESRALTGKVRIKLGYYDDEGCTRRHEAVLTLKLPEGG